MSFREEEPWRPTISLNGKFKLLKGKAIYNPVKCQKDDYMKPNYLKNGDSTFCVCVCLCQGQPITKTVEVSILSEKAVFGLML